MADNGKHEVLYPVAFVPGGDTTRDAFGKHIQEIERIYKQLSGLDSDKLDSRTLTDTMKAHIDNSNPHPNYKPKVSMSEVTGNLDGSRVTGTLNNAKIPNANVTGLEQYVKNLIPEIPDKGEGITASTLEKEGSIKFKNGLIVKWGYVEGIFTQSRGAEHEFPSPFPSQCFATLLTYVREPTSDDSWVQLNTFDVAGFYCTRQADDSHTGASTIAGVTYIAIGK